ncbi:MAG: YqgE/AlgH family protein [Planctomycetota bacterium]
MKPCRQRWSWRRCEEVEQAAVSDIVPGTLLIAGPGLQDPNFRRSVILICEHSAEGSLGLVLNRPLRTPVSQVFPEVEHGDGLIHAGGPVDTNRVMALRRGGHIHETDQQVFESVRLVVSLDDAIAVVRETDGALDDFRFYVGYAGWGSGQLDDELREGAWITAPADERLVFSGSPGQVWREALRSLGGDYQILAEMPLDPNMN